jgi:hypothetical protein
MHISNNLYNYAQFLLFSTFSSPNYPLNSPPFLRGAGGDQPFLLDPFEVFGSTEVLEDGGGGGVV